MGFGKLLFTWLSLVMSMMVSFVLSFFPRDVLDEILNLIESVSEDFPSYFCLKERLCSKASNAVSLSFDPIRKGGYNENGSGAFVHIHQKT